MNQRLVTDDERRAYGDDLLSVVERKALEAFSPHLRQLQNENQNLRQRVARGEAQTIYENLDAALPNWREINTSPEFLEWLRAADIFSGRSKALMLREAFDSGEASRVLAFFAGFLAEHGGQQYAGQQRSRRAEPPVVTNKDLDRFYERVRQGAYEGKSAQKDAEEARLHAAINAGRFRRII